jgi:hypothetical protein
MAWWRCAQVRPRFGEKLIFGIRGFGSIMMATDTGVQETMLLADWGNWLKSQPAKLGWWWVVGKEQVAVPGSVRVSLE